MVVDVKKENLLRHENEQNMQWRVWKIKEKERREKFKDKVKELVNNEAKNLWGLFKDGVLEACEELCGKRKGRRKRGSIWWWNEEVQEVIKEKRMHSER